jgi:hypothetical protein
MGGGVGWGGVVVPPVSLALVRSQPQEAPSRSISTSIEVQAVCGIQSRGAPHRPDERCIEYAYNMCCIVVIYCGIKGRDAPHRPLSLSHTLLRVLLHANTRVPAYLRWPGLGARRPAGRIRLGPRGGGARGELQTARSGTRARPRAKTMCVAPCAPLCLTVSQ